MRPAPKYLRGGVAIPRPLLWGMVALSLAAGVLGYTMGREATQWTETQAISAFAQLYVQQTGGRATECTAVPGEGRVWLMIRCGDGDRQRLYPIARNGDLIPRQPGPDT